MPSSTSSGPSSPAAPRSLASVRVPSGATSATTVPVVPPAITGPDSSTPRRSISAAIRRPVASPARRATSRASPPSQHTQAATFAAWPPGTSAIAAGTSSSGAGGASSRTTTSSSRSPSVTTRTARSWHTRRVEASPGTGRVLVVSGGPAPDAALVGPLPAGAFVIAADSGLEHAAALGPRRRRARRRPRLGERRGRARGRGCGRPRRAPCRSTRRRPTSSSRWSTRSGRGARRVTVVSGGGGARLDHHLAELVLLAAARFAPLRLDARIGAARAVAIHAGEAVALAGEPGAVLTLLALGGPAHGVTTAGLRWPLRGRDARARIDPRRQQRDRLRPGAHRDQRRQPARGGLAPARARRLRRGGQRRRSRCGPGC